MTGPLELFGNPTVGGQAANKNYVDSAIGDKVAKGGDTMSGPLLLASDPAAPLEAATKQYVDTAATPALPAIGETIWFNQNYAPANYLIEDGASYSAVTYNKLFPVLVRSATVTLTIASPGVVTWVGHTLKFYDPVYLTTTGALPTGLTASAGASITTYYVRDVIGDTFKLSATPGGATINFTGAQSGVHTAVNAPHGVANTDLATFRVPNTLGNFIRATGLSTGIDANRAFGAFQAEQLINHSHAGGGLYVAMSGSTYIAMLAYITDPSANFAFGSAQNPPSGTETRPRNVSKLPCIRYQ
jgi:hypothetical protein